MSQSDINICPNCGMENDNLAKFCLSCGKRLLVIKFCPSCGKEIKTQANYCRYCGAALINDIINV